MMIDPEREAWKEEVLGSVENLQSVAPDPFLFSRIEARALGSRASADLVGPWGLRATLAGLVVLARARE